MLKIEQRQTSSGYDIDVVGLYFKDIKEIRNPTLLTRGQEYKLARSLAEERFKNVVFEETQRSGISKPSPVDLAEGTYKQLVRHWDLLSVICSHAGIPDTIPANVILNGEPLHSLTDVPYDKSLLAEISPTIEEASKRLTNFSLALYFLPLSVTEMIKSRDPAKLPKIEEIRAEIGYDAVLLERRFVSVGAEAAEARKNMIESNLRLVVNIAKKYTRCGMLLPDLIEEGNLGLMRALNGFDSGLGYKFSTYAIWWIRQSITRGIADQSRTIRLPVHMFDLVNRVIRTGNRLTQEFGREVTQEELAFEMEYPADKIREIKRAAEKTVSLEAPVQQDDGEAVLGDFIEDKSISSMEEIADKGFLRDEVAEVLRTLPARERRILELRFGIGDGKARSLEEVGKSFGVSRERIRQIEQKGLRQLRHPAYTKRLRFYL